MNSKAAATLHSTLPSAAAPGDNESQPNRVARCPARKAELRRRTQARMSENRLVDYLLHMEQAAADACSFVEGLTKEAFFADRRTQSAVVMCLIVIGEAATKITDRDAAFAQAHPLVPWRSMRGMRNRIAHGYFEIDFNIVWATVRTALPELLEQLPAVRAAADPLPPSDGAP